MPFSKGSSQPRDRTHISQSPALAGGFFTTSPSWQTPKCAYTQLFWVPHSFFVFCWWKHLSRSKQCSTGPGSQPVLVDSPLYNMTVAGQATHQATRCSDSAQGPDSPWAFTQQPRNACTPETYFLLPGWARGPALAWAAHQPLCCPVCLNLSLGEGGSFWACPSLGTFSALGTLKYLAALALINSCHTQDLRYHVCYLLVGACKLLVVAHGI